MCHGIRLAGPRDFINALAVGSSRLRLPLKQSCQIINELMQLGGIIATEGV
jgi:hypothetical protein